MKKITNEKGAITLYVIILVLFLVGILAGTYAVLVNQQADQIDAEQKIKEIYGQGVNEVDAVYQSLIQTTSLSDGSWDIAKGVNSPELLTGMSAVYWDSSNQMHELTMANTKVEWDNWYNYSSKKWANAITRDVDGNITGYWVWIPRYAYKIESGLGTSTAGTISVKFLQGTTNNDSTGGQISTTYPIVTNNAMTSYVVHPAFRNGTANNFSNGEWDKEIPGIWVAKFEAGYAMDKNKDGTSDITGGNNVKPVASSVKYTSKEAWVAAPAIETTTFTTARNWLDGIYASDTNTWLNGVETSIKYPVFVGKTISMSYINLNDTYNLCKVLSEDGNIYGLNSRNMDSHLMKNSEWGATAYLSKSQYGLGSTNIYINNVNLNSGGSATQNSLTNAYAVTGYTGATENAGTNTASNVVEFGDMLGTSNAWYTVNGQKSSSTGNITGIYDLSGGYLETTATYLANNNNRVKLSNASMAYDGDILRTISTKYATIYPHNNTYDNTTISGSAWGTEFYLAAAENYKVNILIYGDAIRETSSSGNNATSWYNDSSVFTALWYPFFHRGGKYGDGSGTGVFSFRTESGRTNYFAGFRAVLIGN